MDTKQAEANTENLIQATSNEKIRRGLILANIRYQDAMEELTRNQADAKKLEFGQITQGIKNLEKAWEQLDENVQGIKMDNKVKRETIETMIKQAQANLQKTMAEILTERTKGQVNAATINDITSQINTRAEQMAQQWRRVRIEGGNYELNKAKFEIEADKMYQQLDLERWRLNNEEKRIIKDYNRRSWTSDRSSDRLQKLTWTKRRKLGRPNGTAISKRKRNDGAAKPI